MCSDEKGRLPNKLCSKCGWEDAPQTHIDTCGVVQLELPFPKHGTAYPKGVEWNLTEEFNAMLANIGKGHPAVTKTEDKEGRWVWECVGCQKQADRLTELCIRRLVDGKLTPESE